MKNGFRFFVIALAAVTGLGLAACKNEAGGGGGGNNWPEAYRGTIWNYNGTDHNVKKLEFGTNTVEVTTSINTNITKKTYTGEAYESDIPGYLMFWLIDEDDVWTAGNVVYLKSDGRDVRKYRYEDGDWVEEQS